MRSPPGTSPAPVSSRHHPPPLSDAAVAGGGNIDAEESAAPPAPLATPASAADADDAADRSSLDPWAAEDASAAGSGQHGGALWTTVGAVRRASGHALATGAAAAASFPVLDVNASADAGCQRWDNPSPDSDSTDGSTTSSTASSSMNSSHSRTASSGSSSFGGAQSVNIAAAASSVGSMGHRLTRRSRRTRRRGRAPSIFDLVAHNVAAPGTSYESSGVLSGVSSAQGLLGLSRQLGGGGDSANNLGSESLGLDSGLLGARSWAQRRASGRPGGGAVTSLGSTSPGVSPSFSGAGLGAEHNGGEPSSRPVEGTDDGLHAPATMAMARASSTAVGVRAGPQSVGVGGGATGADVDRPAAERAPSVALGLDLNVAAVRRLQAAYMAADPYDHGLGIDAFTSVTSEFLQQYTAADSSAFFYLFDTAALGRVKVRQFICGVCLLCRTTREEHIRFLFYMFDVAGAGILQLPAVTQALMLLNRMAVAVARSAAAASSAQGDVGGGRGDGGSLHPAATPPQTIAGSPSWDEGDESLEEFSEADLSEFVSAAIAADAGGEGDSGGGSGGAGSADGSGGRGGGSGGSGSFGRATGTSAGSAAVRGVTSSEFATLIESHVPTAAWLDVLSSATGEPSSGLRDTKERDLVTLELERSGILDANSVSPSPSTHGGRLYTGGGGIGAALGLPPSGRDGASPVGDAGASSPRTASAATAADAMDTLTLGPTPHALGSGGAVADAGLRGFSDAHTSRFQSTPPLAPSDSLVHSSSLLRSAACGGEPSPLASGAVGGLGTSGSRLRLLSDSPLAAEPIPEADRKGGSVGGGSGVSGGVQGPKRTRVRRSKRPTGRDVGAFATEFDSAFSIDYESLKLKKVIGRGACATVWSGSWLRMAVAVKIFDDQSIDGGGGIGGVGVGDRSSGDLSGGGGSGGSRGSGGGAGVTTNTHRTRLGDYLREIETLSQIRHPHLLFIMGMCTVPRLCIVSELYEGGSVHELLHGRNGRPFAPSQALTLLLGVARGMLYLHSSTPVILHRDLKASNILVNKAVSHAVICDFGLSRLSEHAASQSRTGGSTSPPVPVGTAYTMAPEVMVGDPYTSAADVYSFAVVLWEMWTGRVPFPGLKPIQLMFAVSEGNRPPLDQADAWCPELADLVRCCWREDPHERPDFDTILDVLESATISSHAQSLEAVARGGTPLPLPPGGPASADGSFRPSGVTSLEGSLRAGSNRVPMGASPRSRRSGGFSGAAARRVRGETTTPAGFSLGVASGTAPRAAPSASGSAAVVPAGAGRTVGLTPLPPPPAAAAPTAVAQPATSPLETGRLIAAAVARSGLMPERPTSSVGDRDGLDSGSGGGSSSSDAERVAAATRALLEAASERDSVRVRKLLALGASPRWVDYDRRTALMVAAAEGAADVVSDLLEAGALVNARDRWGHTPLDDALQMADIIAQEEGEEGDGGGDDGEGDDDGGEGGGGAGRNGGVGGDEGNGVGGRAGSGDGGGGDDGGGSGVGGGGGGGDAGGGGGGEGSRSDTVPALADYTAVVELLRDAGGVESSELAGARHRSYRRTPSKTAGAGGGGGPRKRRSVGVRPPTAAPHGALRRATRPVRVRRGGPRRGTPQPRQAACWPSAAPSGQLCCLAASFVAGGGTGRSAGEFIPCFPSPLLPHTRFVIFYSPPPTRGDAPHPQRNAARRGAPRARRHAPRHALPHPTPSDGGVGAATVTKKKKKACPPQRLVRPPQLPTHRPPATSSAAVPC